MTIHKVPSFPAPPPKKQQIFNQFSLVPNVIQQENLPVTF